MIANQVLQRCRGAVGAPLQLGLRRLGFPNERTAGGDLFAAIVSKVANQVKLADHTPTGITLEPEIALTFQQFRDLELELGRNLCNSADVLFGSFRVSAFTADEDPRESFRDAEYIDCRDISVATDV